MTIKEIIEDIIKVEGGYSNDPKDSGGATCWGVTEKVAREHGYKGDMRDLPKAFAYNIYYGTYVVAPGFDAVFAISAAIATELVDTGVNMGVGTAGKFLQQALNALNDGGTQYPDLVVDGAIGKGSISSLVAFLSKRGTDGQVVLLRALNSLQCARYITIAEAKPSQERFVFGWILNRVGM